MILNVFKNTVLLFVLVLLSCRSNSDEQTNKSTQLLVHDEVVVSPIVGANQTDEYLPLLNGKSIGIVANQTSVIFREDPNSWTHLVDSLVNSKVNVTKVFAPEHGFRGKADAGEVVKDGMDVKTGLPIISLYGKNKKLSPEMLEGIELMIFDIQDVGARFYTYISSLHYVMEACAESDIPVLILDRPNPNGHYVDGPILEPEHQSFVGMHQVPVVHGMTIGEYAKMINGEGWLKDRISVPLTVIPVKNYSHKDAYSLPIKPSPNLPNDVSIALYPSLCFFEGTSVSVGRGTEMQFQIAGAPYLQRLKQFYFEFTPMPNEGSKYPKHEGKLCFGYDLRNYGRQDELNLNYLLDFYRAQQKYAPDEPFFNNFFTNLSGTTKLKDQIEKGWTADEIRDSWTDDLETFKKIRSKYLLYD